MYTQLSRINNITTMFSELSIALGEHHNSISLNTNILDTNVINITILLSALVYFGKQSLNSILSNRQETVLLTLQEAETKLEQSNIRLSEAEKQLKQTQIVISQIQQEAEITAKKIKDSILAQGKLDIQRLAASSKSSILSAEAAIRRQIQQQITELALKRVTLHLKNQMDENLKMRIMDNNIAQLGGKL